MAEELIGALTRLSQLRVASRTSSFRFRGAEDVRTIGAALGVGAILEGSVRTVGRRVRITAQLTAVRDGYQIWSDRYDRDLDDVFAIQDDIARAIVSALKVKLFGTSEEAIVKARTRSLEAYELCLRGRLAWHRAGYRQAAELFSSALKIDPNYQKRTSVCRTASSRRGSWASADHRRRPRLGPSRSAPSPSTLSSPTRTPS